MVRTAVCMGMCVILVCGCSGGAGNADSGPAPGKREEVKNMTSSRVVREAVGSGRWFPADSKKLKAMLTEYTGNEKIPDVQGRIVSMIAPHAGYVYSGKVAGYCFGAAKKNLQELDCVVVLGFSHSRRFRGMAVMDGDAIKTPLGEVSLDKEAGDMLKEGSDLIFYDYRPHNGEHSAENEVPFVQQAFPGVAVVIGILGDHGNETVDAVSRALLSLAEKKSILVVASSDMLHDHDYDLVTRTDKQTLALVEGMDPDKLLKAWAPHKQVFCGIGPVLCAMKFAGGLGCGKGTVLHYRNSGDDYPESRGQWVVGYGAVAFAVKD